MKVGIGIFIYDTCNLGDWTQSAATLYIWWVHFKKPGTFKNFLETCFEKSEIQSHPIIWIPRDRISKEIKPKGIDKVIVICNAWWMHKYNGEFCFIPPEWISPIYISVHISNPAILSSDVITCLKKHEPIGCRDNSTKNLMEKNGINCYFSGCLTMTMNLKDVNLGFTPQNNYRGKTVIIDYDMDKPENTVTLTQAIHDKNNKQNLIVTIQRSIDLLLSQKVITSRLHVWLPLVCNGANVILMNNSKKKEFMSGDSDNQGQTINRFSGIVEVVKNKSKLDDFRNVLLKRALNEIYKNIASSTKTKVVFNLPKTIVYG
jgi:hypothetical protein